MFSKLDQSKPRDVVAFGRATIDLYANEMGGLDTVNTFSKYLGGSPANTSVAMANIGLMVGYIGKVSKDNFGDYIIQYMGSKGIDTSHIKYDTSGAKSGVTIGEFLSDSQSNYLMYRNDCADLNISVEEIDEDYIAMHKMLLISGASLTQSPARESVFLAIDYAKRNGVAVILDLDYRKNTWKSESESSIYYTLAAKQADIVIGTREEFDVMEFSFHTGNKDDEFTANHLLESGVSIVSIKKGRKGSTVYTQDGGVYRGGIYDVKVNNTFGAGDSYSSAFNYGLVTGKSIEEALKYAAASSAITITGHSCSDSMPSLSQIEEFLKSNEYSVD